MTFVIDGVKVTAINLPDFTREEAANYVEYVREHKSESDHAVAEITITLCNDGKVDVSYLAQGEKFERIRRITG